MDGNLFGTVFILAFVTILLIGYGLSQIFSDTPVHFYSLENPPKIEDKEIMKKWNRAHGLMWVIYGILFAIVSFTYSIIATNETIALVIVFVFLISPLVVMVIIHEKLRKNIYRKRAKALFL